MKAKLTDRFKTDKVMVIYQSKMENGLHPVVTASLGVPTLKKFLLKWCIQFFTIILLSKKAGLCSGIVIVVGLAIKIQDEVYTPKYLPRSNK